MKTFLVALVLLAAPITAQAECTQHPSFTAVIDCAPPEFHEGDWWPESECVFYIRNTTCHHIAMWAPVARYTQATGEWVEETLGWPGWLASGYDFAYLYYVPIITPPVEDQVRWRGFYVHADGRLTPFNSAYGVTINPETGGVAVVVVE